MSTLYCPQCNSMTEHNTAGCTAHNWNARPWPSYDEAEVRWYALQAEIENRTAKRIAEWLHARQQTDNETLVAIQRGDWRKP